MTLGWDLNGRQGFTLFNEILNGIDPLDMNVSHEIANAISVTVYLAMIF